MDQICTEILYQPLTLLDCLHTFCGLCLKEWFTLQASRASSSTTNPFTCPSCRASIRETRPDAKVTTLLEMYLQANPSRARSEQEKEESKMRYTAGENVLPKTRRGEESEEEAYDRRMVEEAQAMSLRDVGIRGPGVYERALRHRPRENLRTTREENTRLWIDNHTGINAATDSTSHRRQIEHQSSLRSLLSSSEADSSDVREEILRQIMDEGILDGIDLSNIDISQEDELTERIVEAYRRRHGQRSRSPNRSESTGTSIPRDHISGVRQQRQHRRPARSPNVVDHTTHPSHPPVSRPHLLEAYPTGHGHRRRTSSETRRQTSPVPASANAAVPSNPQRQAARSATDLSSRPRSSSNQRGRPTDFSGEGRRTTDPERLHLRGESQSSASRTSAAPRSPRGQAREASSATASRVPSSAVSPPHSAVVAVPAARTAEPVIHQPLQQHESPRSPPENSSEQSVPNRAPPTLYPEPSIRCDRCGKSNIEYELHHNCANCNGGKYNVCLRCYRLGRGCLRWYGFGHAAVQRFARQAPPSGYPPDHPLPHRFNGHRFLQPPAETRRVVLSDSKLSTSSDPSTRLQSGPFCSNCSNFAPDCFWRCEYCNEGEWGFCNPCVNRGKCCTHALLPVKYTCSNATSTTQLLSPTQRVSSTCFTPISDPLQSHLQSLDQTSDQSYTPLSFSTDCDICTYPIPPSITRFHCPQCNGGDYDICTTCYNRLANTGKITSENGPQGWRRCPRDHRMMVVGFEDSASGQRRIVVKDIVGGLALKDEAENDSRGEWSWWDEEQQQRRQAKPFAGETPPTDNNTASSQNPPPSLLKKYPPNGGVGIRVLALWGYWPEDGVRDELAFPKGAEIRECEDINQDWFWGVYCGRKGLFPGNHGRVVGVVGL